MTAPQQLDLLEPIIFTNFKYKQPCLIEAINTCSAAARASTNTNAGRAAVLAYLRQCGEHGATDAEILAHTDVHPNAVRPRRGELAKAGLVVNSGQKRRTETGCLATVWRAKG